MRKAGGTTTGVSKRIACNGCQMPTLPIRRVSDSADDHAHKHKQVNWQFQLELKATVSDFIGKLGGNAPHSRDKRGIDRPIVLSGTAQHHYHIVSASKGEKGQITCFSTVLVRPCERYIVQWAYGTAVGDTDTDIDK